MKARSDDVRVVEFLNSVKTSHAGRVRLLIKFNPLLTTTLLFVLAMLTQSATVETAQKSSNLPRFGASPGMMFCSATLATISYSVAKITTSSMVMTPMPRPQNMVMTCSMAVLEMIDSGGARAMTNFLAVRAMIS